METTGHVERTGKEMI